MVDMVEETVLFQHHRTNILIHNILLLNLTATCAKSQSLGGMLDTVMYFVPV
jgi:hypothetical protein